MYDYTDKAVEQLNKRYIRLFGKLRTLKFDELSIIETVSYVYDQCAKLAKKRYLEIAVYTYKRLYGENGKSGINVDWIDDILEEYDPVTLYIFNNEVERKKHRLIETLVASAKRQEEIKKALRFWTLQSTQFAVTVTDKAAEKAYKDKGVKYVKWIALLDKKVCRICEDRDGKIYKLSNVPDKPHINCRCFLRPIKDG